MIEPDFDKAVLDLVATGATYFEITLKLGIKRQPEIREVLEQHGYCRNEAGVITKKGEAARPAPEVLQPDTEESPEEEREEEDNRDLLPIAKLPGYKVDRFGLPHADKRRGRKGGPVKPDRFFRRDGTFICGFRIRVDGQQVRYTPRYFQMARFFAEKKRENAGLAK
jgi:hypothetical protein